MGKTKTKRSAVKKILKRDLVSNRKYRTTYKDIKKYNKDVDLALMCHMQALGQAEQY